MKNSIRILSVTTLTAIYLFALSFVSISLVNSDYENHKTTEQEQHLVTISHNLFCDTSQSVSSISSFSNFSVSSSNDFLDKHRAICEATEQFYETIFSQYTGFSISILICYRKTTIIFPFHYFW